MNLIVDIGNTRVKIALMADGKLLSTLNRDHFRIADIEAMRADCDIGCAIICSTRGTPIDVAEQIRGVVPKCIIFDSSTPIPIGNSYSTPKTLGLDRLAAAVGAATISNAENQLVVDCGTAITIDLVTRSGGFEGGTISPGVSMRFRALNEFTASLPLCAPTDDVLDVARSTREAIEQGVMSGVVAEVEAQIAKMSEKFEKIDVIFTGGERKYFENRIKNPIFASDELVFVGLNKILEYNVK